MHYTERIRALREDRDLTQEKIARIFHVGQEAYSHYETGKNRIPLDSLIVLAKYYNVNLDYLCGVSNVMRAFPQR